eukprot:197929-Hanusia_phi.AAC.3
MELIRSVPCNPFHLPSSSALHSSSSSFLLLHLTLIRLRFPAPHLVPFLFLNCHQHESSLPEREEN